MTSISLESKHIVAEVSGLLNYTRLKTPWPLVHTLSSNKVFYCSNETFCKNKLLVYIYIVFYSFILKDET